MNMSLSAITLVIAMCAVSVTTGWMLNDLGKEKTYFTLKQCPIR
ncbi:hypothetical protein [Limnobaculum xujianqingii]|nr:hypothetical protein [Limnobaculum xujianqingii]